MKRLLTGLLVCGAWVAVHATANTALFYRYQNEQGVTVIGNSIPSDAVDRGYQIIQEDGTVVKTVPRKLTDAEIAQKEREAEEEKKRQDAGAARKRHDEELVKLYASARDVEEARDRKLLSIDTSIATTKINLERLKQQKERLQTQAADREREGLAPSADILDNLAILDNQIADGEREIDARKVEKQRVKEQFDADLERIKLLYGSPTAKQVSTATSNALH